MFSGAEAGIYWARKEKGLSKVDLASQGKCFPISIYFSYKAACRIFALHETSLKTSHLLGSASLKEAQKKKRKGSDNFCVAFVTLSCKSPRTSLVTGLPHLAANKLHGITADTSKAGLFTPFAFTFNIKNFPDNS